MTENRALGNSRRSLAGMSAADGSVLPRHQGAEPAPVPPEYSIEWLMRYRQQD